MIIPPEETLKMENEDVPMDNKGGGEVEGNGTEFDDLAVEADKIEAPRCTKCRRMTSGHEGPYGSKCDLKILNTEELKEDDIQKLKAKEIKKKEKRKGDHEDDNEAMKKKRREEKEEEDRLNKARKEQEEMQKRIDNQREERRKVERETKKMKETLDTDVRRTSKGYSNWRDNQNPKNVNSRTRENENTSKRYENDRRNPSPRRGHSSRRLENDRRNQSPRDGYSSRRLYDDRRSPRSNREYRHSPRRERSRQESTPRWFYESQRRERNKSPSKRNERSRSGTRISSRRMDHSRIDEITSSMVQALSRVNVEDDKKIDPVPTWEESTSFQGWKKEILIWSKARGRPERKTQMLLEYLKKDPRKGLKELAVNEFIENDQFSFEDESALSVILNKIGDFIDESKWNKTIKLVKDFKNFKQEESENNKEFVTRFTTMETRMKNVGTELPKLWLAAELVTRSKLNKLQKHNVLSTVDTEDDVNILKIIKKKLKDLDACESEEEPKRTLYTEQPRHRSYSKERGNGYRGRSFSKDRRNQYRSSSRNRDRRSSQREPFQKDGRTNFQRDGKNNTSPGNKNNDNTPKRTYHVTLKIDNKRSIFENEVENKALVDSGCPELVAGLSWLKTYESSKGEEFKTIQRSDTFKMGNDNFKTLMYKRIPVRIGEQDEELEVGIINTEIPLLISKKKLKEWGGRIDFQENTLYLRKSGETIQMEETSTGHLVINLSKDLKKDKDEAIQELFLMKQNKDYNMKSLKKLHRVFGHPTEEKLMKLMEDAGIDDPHISRILKKIQECCRICQKYRKKQSRPKTAFPKARSLNEAVSLDLKPVSSLLEDAGDKRQIVYMMDEFSRYTVGAISKSKEPEEVAKLVLDEWCLRGMSYPSGYFFCDNGSEFKGRLLEAVAKKTGIKIKLTPSYSSWSNGGIERKHGAIDLTIRKMMEDDQELKLEDALQHATWSRNMEIGRFGFSPYQIAYGKSPFLPGISEGTILTDQTIPQEDIVMKHWCSL